MSDNPTLIHLISSNHWGGAQKYALDICGHFHRQNWNVFAVTRDAKVVDDRFRSENIPLIHAPLRGFFDPASAFIIASKLREIPLNRGFIHVHRYRDAFTALLAKRIAKRPDIRVISTRHKVRPGRNSWIFRRIYDKINAHIFVSRTAFDRFRSSWPNRLPMRADTVHIILNSINIPLSVPTAPPEKGPIIALYAGPVVKGKGIETIIDALPSLRGLKIRLKIAGKGDPDYFDHLRRRAMTRNVMEMIDWKASDDHFDDLFAQAHFMVLPSVEREGFGLSNLRAMAAGRPQICSTSGAQSEYLEDGRTALFVPPADTQALADAMRKLAADPLLRNEIGTLAFRNYSEFLSWQTFIPRLTGIYLSC